MTEEGDTQWNMPGLQLLNIETVADTERMVREAIVHRRKR